MHFQYPQHHVRNFTSTHLLLALYAGKIKHVSTRNSLRSLIIVAWLPCVVRVSTETIHSFLFTHTMTNGIH